MKTKLNKTRVGSQKMSKAQTKKFVKGFQSHTGDMPESTRIQKSLARDPEQMAKDMATSSAHSYASMNQDDLAENMQYDVKKLIEEKQEEGKLVTQEDLDNLQDEIDEIAQDLVSDDINEPIATIYVNDSKTPNLIGSYDFMGEDVDPDEFQPRYVKTDGWRGYYEVDADSNKWKLLHTDNILFMSEDEKDLKKFDDELQATLTEKGIDYARVFTRSSNVFSTGYDFFVDKDRIGEVRKISKELGEKYR